MPVLNVAEFLHFRVNQTGQVITFNKTLWHQLIQISFYLLYYKQNFI